MKMGISCRLAVCMNRLVHSRTWVRLPGLEEIWDRLMVWMESMMTTSGSVEQMVSQIASASFTVSRYRLSVSTPSRCARSLICRADSSPDT